MTEILSYTAYRQLSQMFLAVAFFHSSEYILAVINYVIIENDYYGVGTGR